MIVAGFTNEWGRKAAYVAKSFDAPEPNSWYSAILITGKEARRVASAINAIRLFGVWCGVPLPLKEVVER